MKRTHHKRIAVIFLGLLTLLIALPLVATWRQATQERLNQALIVAVKANDDKAVVALLDQGTDANCRYEPPSKFSFWQSLMRIVAGIPAQPARGPTPLQLALDIHDLPIGKDTRAFPPENVPLVRALLDHGAQVNQTNSDGLSPLVCAIIGGKCATARLLFARGATLAVRNERKGYDPSLLLIQVAANPHSETGLMADLLDRGVDVNERIPGGPTALFLATEYGRVAAVRLLLARHADVTLTYGAVSPLAIALFRNTPQTRQIARLLKGASCRSGWTRRGTSASKRPPGDVP